MEQTTKCAPMDSSFPHSSVHVSLGLHRMDHWQDFPTHQKCLAIDRLGDSAFPKKLSPQWIPASVDLEDSIIGATTMKIRAVMTFVAVQAASASVHASGRSMQTHSRLSCPTHPEHGDTRFVQHFFDPFAANFWCVLAVPKPGSSVSSHIDLILNLTKLNKN